MLSMFGYSTAASPQARHNALVRAVNQGRQQPLAVMRRLKLVQTYTKRSQKRASATYGSDYNWMHNRYYN